MNAERRKVTTRDVAHHAGVSIGTVANVLNHPHRVTPAMIEKVQASFEALGFVRNEAARHLRAGRSNVIGLVLPGNEGPYFSELAHSIEDAADEVGAAVLHATTRYAVEREERYIQLFEEQRVRGLIVMPANGPTARLASTIARGTPMTLIFQQETGPFDSIAVDDRAGGALAMEHLQSLGHRRIAFVGGPLTRHGIAERFAGAKAAADPATRLDVLPTSDMTFTEGFLAGRTIADMPADERPTAIFAANDYLAIAIQLVARDCGLRIPEQLAIVGFDDSEQSLRGSSTITSVKQPTMELGSRAVDLLSGRIEDPDAPPRNVVLSPTLVVRGSTVA